MAARFAVGAACLISTVSCGSEMLRTGRSPVYLVVTGVEATSGHDQESGVFLQSDVIPVFNDSLVATIAAVRKNQDLSGTPVNSVTLTRFHVDFRRTDGRNTPGVDVPYGFDGGLSVTIPPDGEADAVLILVRNQAKLEAPLLNLRGLGGQVIISTIAEVTFYGHDQNGNEVSVTARVDVHFADYANDE